MTGSFASTLFSEPSLKAMETDDISTVSPPGDGACPAQTPEPVQTPRRSRKLSCRNVGAEPLKDSGGQLLHTRLSAFRGSVQSIP